LKTLKEKLNNGDYLIYTDAQIIYTDKADKLIDFLKERKAEMWAEKLICCKEKQFSKRDAFVLIGVDKPFYTDTNQ
jgi:capsule polysaccharide modification protein KpsS